MVTIMGMSIPVAVHARLHLQMLLVILLVIVLTEDYKAFTKRDVVLRVEIHKRALCQLACLCIMDWLL